MIWTLEHVTASYHPPSETTPRFLGRRVGTFFSRMICAETYGGKDCLKVRYRMLARFATTIRLATRCWRRILTCQVPIRTFSLRSGRSRSAGAGRSSTLGHLTFSSRLSVTHGRSKRCSRVSIPIWRDWREAGAFIVFKTARRQEPFGGHILLWKRPK